MKKLVIAFMILIALAVGWYLGSPLFLDKEVSESVEEIAEIGKEKAMEPSVVASGLFAGADDFHKAAGTARLLKIGDRYILRFEEDFSITNGPDLFVYFGNNDVYDKDTRIAALKGNIGSQNYEVPVDIDPLQYSEVWIWCRAFSVPFEKAVIQRVQ